MVVPKINSAHGSDTRNILNRAIDLINVQGKSIQDLVAEGQLTPEQYADLIKDVNGLVAKGAVTFDDIDINKGKLLPKHLSEEVLKMVTGNAPINAVPADGAITKDKLAEKSVGLSKLDDNFEKAMVAKTDYGSSINAKKGSLSVSNGSETSSNNTIVTDFIDNPGQALISFKGLHSRIFIFNSSGALTGTSGWLLNSSFFVNTGGRVRVLLRKEDVTDIVDGDIAQVMKNLKVQHFYTNEDTIADRSVTRNKISKGAVDIPSTDFMNISSNIFDERKVLKGVQLTSATGEELLNEEYVSTPYYPVTPGEVISSNNFNRGLYYDADGKYLPPAFLPGEGNVVNPGVSFVRYHGIRNTVLDNKTQINRSGKLLPYEGYYVAVNDFKISGNFGGDNNRLQDEMTLYSPAIIGENLVMPDLAYKTWALDDLYSAYNTLISKYPKYFSKKMLGKDATGNYDIFQYRLKPEEYSRTEINSGRFSGKLPKVIFLANIHGGERPSALAAYYLTKALCENWQDNEMLEYLRWNIEFVFIPVLNPYGYVTGDYKNSNGVNIQTNFSEGWGAYPNPESATYNGPSPFSEIETQHAKKMIDENSDAVFFMDVHSSNYSADFYEGYDSLYYYVVPDFDHHNADLEFAIKYSVERNSRFLKKNYPINRSNMLGYYGLRKGTGTADAYAAGKYSIPSLVPELFYNLPYEEEKYSPTAIKAATEVFSNTILDVLRRFKEVNNK